MPPPDSCRAAATAADGSDSRRNHGRALVSSKVSCGCRHACHEPGGLSMKDAAIAGERERSPLRRRLLQVGGIGVLGLGLPDVLRAETLRRERKEPARACIFIVQYGGASHLDSWDLKPEATEDIRGPYKPISTPVPGMQVCELLPRLARLAPRYALIRSMTHGDAGHDGGMHICMTGHSNPVPD